MTDNALALIEPKNIAQYFEPNGLDQIIERIRQEVSGFVPDISTDKGRKEIASLAYKVAKSKTTLDGMGKELVSGIKDQAKAIDAERKRAWDALEAIQHDVRAPLTEWEKREKERVAGHEAAIADLMHLSTDTDGSDTAAEIEWRIKSLAHFASIRDWQEFAQRAKQTEETAHGILTKKLEVRRQYDADQAELARLRQEQVERQQRERDELLQAEAAAKAKAEAEERALRNAEAEAARVREEQERAEQERRRIDLERKEALARAAKAAADRLAAIAQAEADRKAAEEKAAADARAAEEKAKRDAEAAAQAERDRIAAEQRAEAEAQAKREANKRHRAKIDGEASEALLKVLAGDNLLNANAAARSVVEAIAHGEITHVKIVY